MADVGADLDEPFPEEEEPEGPPELESGKMYLCLGRHDDDGTQYRWVFLCNGAYARNAVGQFARGELVITNDEYWAWYMKLPGEQGRVSRKWLLHACPTEECDAKALMEDVEVIHVCSIRECLLDEAMELAITWRRTNSALAWPVLVLGPRPASLDKRWEAACRSTMKAKRAVATDEYGFPEAWPGGVWAGLCSQFAAFRS